MLFCEECGEKLLPGMKFCEACGAPVPDDECDAKTQNCNEAMTILCRQDYQLRWTLFVENHLDGEVGILLTDSQVLAGQMGCEAEAVRSAVAEYIAEAVRRSVFYVCLDLSCLPMELTGRDAASVVRLLWSLADIAPFKYLFIVGNEEVASSVLWENPASDDDEDVLSDFCYTVLNTDSPDIGYSYSFKHMLRVGRFPVCDDDTLETLENYFRWSVRYSGKMAQVHAYGLTAAAWEKETRAEFSTFTSVPPDSSPDIDLDSIVGRIDESHNLLFFNLHGSNDTPFWYGQDGWNYPEALAPTVFDDRETPYFLGVEACYGARWGEDLTPDESILLTALRNKCLAFLGSGRIAFGTSEPEGNCADIMVGEWVRRLTKGMTAGDAYIAAVEAIVQSMDEDAPTDSSIKTIEEFALYGDPSVRLSEIPDNAADRLRFNKTSCAAHGKSRVRIVMPDVRQAVRRALADVDKKIAATIDRHVRVNVFPWLSDDRFSDGKITTWKIGDSGMFQRTYSFPSEIGPCIAMVCFRDDGTVSKTLISK